VKELIIGTGFVAEAYKQSVGAEHEVIQTSRHPEAHPGTHPMDLGDVDSIEATIRRFRPDVIVNGAAILGRNNDKHLLGQNPQNTHNLLTAIHKSDVDVQRTVILGSAAAYGPVTPEQLPVGETAPMQPSDQDMYGQSKRDEADVARRLADEYDLSVVEGRIFTLLGPNLPASSVSSRITKQLEAINTGEQDPIVELRRLDARRDYLDVRDCATAIGQLAHGETLAYDVYNLGSGASNTNETLVEMAIRHRGMTGVAMRQTGDQPEQLVGAAHADITRLQETGWTAQHSLDQTMAGIVAEAGFAPSAQHYAA
jgi:GDP-4-dehydro-6-deoxy-D-mannose reductase